MHLRALKSTMKDCHDSSDRGGTKMFCGKCSWLRASKNVYSALIWCQKKSTQRDEKSITNNCQRSTNLAWWTRLKILYILTLIPLTFISGNFLCSLPPVFFHESLEGNGKKSWNGLRINSEVFKEFNKSEIWNCFHVKNSWVDVIPLPACNGRVYHKIFSAHFMLPLGDNRLRTADICLFALNGKPLPFLHIDSIAARITNKESSWYLKIISSTSWQWNDCRYIISSGVLWCFISESFR